MIFILHSENLYTFQNANTTLNIKKTVARTCEKVFRLNRTSTISTCRPVLPSFQVDIQKENIFTI